MYSMSIYRSFDVLMLHFEKKSQILLFKTLVFIDNSGIYL